MITGIAVLALVFFSPQLKAMGTDVDFEQILPYVITNFIPTGLVGFMLAGLLAAFMSTFDSTVNSGAAYIVNDIYKRYINPNASDKRYVRISYVCSVLIVIVGIAFGFITESIDSVLNWIVAGLYGGYIAPNVLRWHWWRMNGFGYFAGMTAGIASALVLPKILPNLSALNSFPINLALSAIASVVVSLMTPPDTPETLKGFYQQVRPWGFWKPIADKIKAEQPGFEPKTDCGRHWFNVIVGIIWQTSLVALPIYVVIQRPQGILGALLVLAATTAILKKSWFDHLPSEK